MSDIRCPKCTEPVGRTTRKCPRCGFEPTIDMEAQTRHTEQTMSENSRRQRIEQAKKTLREWTLPQVDNAALIDYIDCLDERGYHDEISLDPEEKVDDVVFEVALAVGYDLALRDVAEGTSTVQ